MPDETPQQKHDRSLIEKIAQGDQAAFGLLYDRISAPLFSLLWKMLGDSAEAEDALQEICLQIWRRASSYDARQSTVFSWAVLLARGKAIDRLRARGRRARIVSGFSDENEISAATIGASIAQTAADTINKNEDAARVRSILQSLPPDQRQAIEMAFFPN